MFNCPFICWSVIIFPFKSVWPLQLLFIQRKSTSFSVTSRSWRMSLILYRFLTKWSSFFQTNYIQTFHFYLLSIFHRLDYGRLRLSIFAGFLYYVPTASALKRFRLSENLGLKDYPIFPLFCSTIVSRIYHKHIYHLLWKSVAIASASSLRKFLLFFPLLELKYFSNYSIVVDWNLFTVINLFSLWIFNEPPAQMIKIISKFV